MKRALTIFLLFEGTLALAGSSTEVITQLQTYNAFIRHNYQMFGGENLKLTLYSQKQGPAFLTKEEFSQNIGIPLDLRFRTASTGVNVSLEQNSRPNVPKRFMLNWYVSKSLSKKLGANFNFYTDRQERDRTFTYANFNAGLNYELAPRLRLNLRTEAGKGINDREYTLNHILATTWSF